MIRFKHHQQSWIARWMMELRNESLSPAEYQRFVYEECRLIDISVTREEAADIARHLGALNLK